MKNFSMKSLLFALGVGLLPLTLSACNYNAPMAFDDMDSGYAGPMAFGPSFGDFSDMGGYGGMGFGMGYGMGDDDDD